ncbi:MAG: GNAT family N-acetyltransferase [Flavobacteriaceae bacterium]|nr:GNAT family N-acetyltransferase [Flavobacteriaceae bacterium]
MIKIIKAHKIADYKLIAQLAATIWREHYTSIIGSNQVEYMLAKYQSASAIEEQVKLGFNYFMVTYQEKPVAYLSFKEEIDSLFLSKIYVLSNYRGMNIGKTAMVFIEKKAVEIGCNKISLTVNKYNTSSINIYEKIGFQNMGSIINDIGNGFVMDDYIMEKIIVK